MMMMMMMMMMIIIMMMIYDKNEYGDDEISSSSCPTSFTYLMFHPASCSKGPHPVALGQPTGRG